MPRPRRDDDIHFEEDAPAYRADSRIHVSSDGLRGVEGLVNVRPQKCARVAPGRLADTYADWTPIPNDDLADVHAVADTVMSYGLGLDDDKDETGKRKRYKSSVR